MKRVCIDPGHGGIQPGAVYGDLLEKDVNLKVAEYAVEGLRAVNSDIWIGLTRTFDRTTSLQERCDLSNGMNVDCFISIHCNADPDTDEPGMPEARGEEIWFFKGSREGLKLSQCLSDEVDQIFPDEPFRGIKETEGLYVLKHTNAPACLIEIGFIDKSSSVETFSDELTLRKIGALVARGINEYLSLVR
jgi:N-acetylmuramoyl-L-alanine amidase